MTLQKGAMVAMNFIAMNHLLMNTTIPNHIYVLGHNNATYEQQAYTIVQDSTSTENVKPYYVEDTISIHDVNAHEVAALYPLIVFYVTLLLIGVLGNGLVLLVYSFRYQGSPARVYILFLAGIDFAICLFGIPYHLVDMTNPYTYTNDVACKSLTFIITTLFHMSIFGLIVIAVDRYLKICKPLGKLQVDYFGKKRACGAAVLAALLLSWPNIILYGRSEMESSIENITGYACFFETQYYETSYPFIYIMSTLAVCISSTAFLIMAYSLICHQIWKRYRHSGNKNSWNEDTEQTEEVTLKYLANEGPRHTSTSNLASSRETVGSANSGPQQDALKANERPLEHHREIDDAAVVYTSSGSVKLIGVNHIPVESSNKVVDADGCEQINETSALLNETKEKLTENDKCEDEDEFNEQNGKSLNRNSEDTNSQRNTESKPSDKQIGRHSIFHTKCNISRINLLRNQGMMSSVSDDDLVQNLSRDSGKRFSLQVPNTYSNVKKALSFRRTSDTTDTLHENDQKCWNSNFSVVMAGGLTRGRSSDSDGLRIHYSSHHSIASSLGPVKANKPVTKQHSKITKIMLTITIIFILSYAPALVVTIWSIVEPEFWDHLSVMENIICEFCLRFYLVNNVCNPFIYGFWDKRFKREIVFTFKKLTPWLRYVFRCEFLTCSKSA
ncbi:hypothetical protein ACF0H5_022515 [Mactra antiquata]